jgi:serine/threonine protein kinase
VKTKNLLLLPSGEVVFTDFGLAKRLTDNQTGPTGSAHCMSRRILASYFTEHGLDSNLPKDEFASLGHVLLSLILRDDLPPRVLHPSDAVDGLVLGDHFTPVALTFCDAYKFPKALLDRTGAYILELTEGQIEDGVVESLEELLVYALQHDSPPPLLQQFEEIDVSFLC